MGIFTRLFRGQEGEADEGQSSEEEPMDSGQAKPPEPSAASEPAAPTASESDAKRVGNKVDKPRPQSDSDRHALLSPNPTLAGGLKVASRPRRNKGTNPPSEGQPPVEQPSPPVAQAMEKKPPRPALPKQRGDATVQVAVPPPVTARPSAKPPATPSRPAQPVRSEPPATPQRAPVAKTQPHGSGPTVPPRQPATPATTAPATKPSRGTARVIPEQPPSERRRRSPISEAFDSLLEGDSRPGLPGVSSDADRAEVQGVFDDLAAEHVEVVRNVMLELEIEDVGCSWIETSKPPLLSLRTMADEMELAELCAAIDGFCEAVDKAVGSGQSTVSGESKAVIQRRYQRLIELIPQAFALEGERDRREPIIVESLLRQVPGVEKITIDKLFAVGLNKLTALIRSNAGDIAATSGIDPALADQIAGRFRDYRSAVPSAVAAQDSVAERAALADLLAELKRHHDDYNAAAAGWSDDDRAKKREARRLREEAFLRVRVALARLGETDSLQAIEKRPFDQRIAAVEKLLEKEDNGRAHA